MGIILLALGMPLLVCKGCRRSVYLPSGQQAQQGKGKNAPGTRAQGLRREMQRWAGGMLHASQLNRCGACRMVCGVCWGCVWCANMLVECVHSLLVRDTVPASSVMPMAMDGGRRRDQVRLRGRELQCEKNWLPLEVQSAVYVAACLLQALGMASLILGGRRMNRSAGVTQEVKGETSHEQG